MRQNKDPARSRPAGSFALALVVLTPTLTLPVEAVKQSDIDALKEDANDLASQRKKLQERINALKSDKSKAIAAKGAAGRAGGQHPGGQINNVQRQIDSYDRPHCPDRGRAGGGRSGRRRPSTSCSAPGSGPWRSGATSATGRCCSGRRASRIMLSRLDAINELMDSDQAVIDRLQALQEEIEDQAGGPGGAEGRGGERQGGAPAARRASWRTSGPRPSPW